MRLTIKDKKNIKISRINNYLVYKLQYYIRKGFFKSLLNTFKNFKIGRASKI